MRNHSYKKKLAWSRIYWPFPSSRFSIVELNRVSGETATMSRFVPTLITAVAMAASAAAQAGTWKIDPMHSSAQFSVRHLGVSTVRGAFTKVSGSAHHSIPPTHRRQCLDATIEATSVDTRVEMRDNDLRSPNFFEVQKYPTITFHAKQTKAAGPGQTTDYGRSDHSRRDQRSRARCGRTVASDERSVGQPTAHRRIGDHQN